MCLLRSWMGKLQTPSMQCLAGDSWPSLMIKRVPEHGVTNVGKVHPNLVGAAAFQAGPQQAGLGACAEHSVTGPGRFTSFLHRPFDTMVHRSADGHGQFSLRGHYHPLDNGKILPD